MTLIETTDRSAFYALYYGGDIVSTGELSAGDYMATSRPVVVDTDENEFLRQVAGTTTDYNPLPVQGEWCEAGEIYGYDDGLVICRQSHTRTEHAPADVPALFIVYREDAGEALDWIAGEQVEVGTWRAYDNTVYEALQAHVTQADWTPPATPALWRVVAEEPQTGEWAPGAAYTIGDLVTYDGTEYKCRQSHTARVGWEPSNTLALWLPI